tara:strand:+ start:14037 stop:15059 length:1023 start_codon:yes stop_codon:yes gene_type:complete
LAIATIVRSTTTINDGFGAYNDTATGVLVEHGSDGTHAVVTATSVAVATITGVTTLTASGNLDIGSYDFRAATLTADGLTSGRVAFATTNGRLTDDADFVFATDTLTVTKIASFILMGKLTAGVVEIEGSNFDINGGTVDGITSLTAAGNLDIGSYELKAQTFESDVTTGTAPLTIASTTVVPNLNVDQVDGFDFSQGVSIGNVPAFLVAPASNQLNFATASDVTVVWGTEIYDIGGNFASNAFTAPVTGKYLLQACVHFQNIDTAGGLYQVQIATSNRVYRFKMTPTQFAADVADWSASACVVADMDTSDIAEIRVAQQGGTAQADISTDSWFSGVLVG